MRRTYTIYVQVPEHLDLTAEQVADDIQDETGYLATPMPPREKV